MTLASTSPKEIKNGNDVTTVFSFTFVINASTDMVVTHTDSLGAETIITEGTGTNNYSISVANYPGSGSITYPATLGTELATGAKLTLARVVDIDQETDLQNQAQYKPETVESTFDYSRMVDLQQQEQIDRSITAPISTVLTSNTILGTIDTTVRALTITSAGPASSALSVFPSTIDVVLTGEANGDFLQYDGANFVNKTVAQIKSTLDLKLNNYTATVAPTVNDDSGDGYSVGSRWYDVTGDDVYHCLDATVGAAVWNQGDIVASDLGAAALLGSISSSTFAGATSSNINTASETKTYIDTEVATATSQRYISAEQTITSGGLLTLTHGLTVTDPHTINLRYHVVCKTAEYGYSVGDIVPIDFNMSSLGNNHYSMAVLNTTEINIRYSSDASVFNAGNFTTGAVEAFTNANWKLVVVAEIVK